MKMILGELIHLNRSKLTVRKAEKIINKTQQNTNICINKSLNSWIKTIMSTKSIIMKLIERMHITSTKRVLAKLSTRTTFKNR